MYIHSPSASVYASWEKATRRTATLSPYEFIEFLALLKKIGDKFTIDGEFCGFISTVENTQLEPSQRLGVPPAGLGDQGCCPAELSIREVKIRVMDTIQ